MSCPQIWNIEQEKDREKEKVGDRPAKLNEKKSDRQLERDIKDKGDIFLLEEQHGNFVAATKVKMRAVKKKINKNRYDISSTKRVTRKVLEVSRCSRATQRQRTVQKVCYLIRPIVVFSPFSFPSPLSITRLYILFEQTINIIESFAFSPC